jgi:hypothetical protein
MQKLTHESIQQLLETSETPKVTIYIPLETSAAPPHITENQIRFKNLIHQASTELTASGDTSELNKNLRDFLERTSDDLAFWKDKTRGMLIVATSSMIKTFDLPVDTEEYVAVDDTFHLAPVMGLLGDARSYYVLALAQQNPKVFEGDMYGLSEIQPGLPRTMREGLGIDEANQQSENQASASGSSLNTGGFNGRGGARDPQNTDRLRYFHMIDKILCDKLDRSVPLIIAGIDAETAEFKGISKYPKILQGNISGNHTETRLEELAEKAQQIVRAELIRPEHTAAREEYERLQGANPERVTRDKDDMIEAAQQGRVDKLLATMCRRTTDTVQDAVESVFCISFPEAKTSRMLNKLAVMVWQMSGKVISLLPDEMPGGTTLVARLRY